MFRRTRLSLLLCLTVLPVFPAGAASPAPVAAEHGMVVTAQRLASEIGVEVLRSGGNAVDAAVAVGYALAVVYPTAGNLGGGGFMTLRLKDGTARFIDFRERAPGKATKDMYLDAKGDPVPGLSTDGYLAVGVPSSVAGFEHAREHFGTKDRAALLAPAIRLARDGFELSPGDVASFAEGNADLAKDPAAAAIFLKNGTEPYGAGEKLVQSDLAGTLEAIAQRGPDGFYKGAAAEAIAQASAAHGGILERSDFEAYKVRELDPVRCDYRGYEIISSPPPSSGGVVICEILNILEAYPLSYTGYGSAETVHLMAEAMRQAFVDRNSALGDPDFVKNPTETLLSQAYADKVRARIDPNRAGVSASMKPVGAESHETTHYSIIDKDGNAVAVTYTLNGAFGARVVAPGTGVLLNNEMDDFTQKPGVPNLYGLVQGEANAIAPGKTPLSSMSPTIITQKGEPVMVIGSPGGSRIITIVAEAIMNVVDHGMDIQEAVDAPRIHHQWQPDRITMEPRALSPDTIRLLAAKGHVVREDPNWPVWGEAAGILVGGPSLAKRDPQSPNRFFGAMDARAGAGAAIGY
ncbi:gamma-glutamyltranspeptidase [Aureimonas ureilytica]|uniref:Glutathione hydrolase proenzyme n=1 Tax=Aureimonas ureilytica TaxID=401562 RepID=A0A175RL79_9HYPH|nr:gamma-glutamyltransferase [Aureimonas ureilytica]KTR04078.1 gamma-glutamyltranspeptidase [Aureimonas ureilytica]